MGLLVAQNLTVHNQAGALVNGIDFTVREGETLCLVGESGSGKTLSALAVMGLLPDGLTTAANKLSFEGQDLLTLPPHARRKLRGAAMTMIFQEPMTALNPVMRVGDQVAEVFEIHTSLTHKERKHKVLQLLERVQIDDVERRYNSFPHQLSGGQRQRILIAMAVAMKPKLLIADEPTTALDVTVQGEILSLIRDLKNQMGTAVLFITHDFGVVRAMADSVVVMQHGKVVEQDTVGNILEYPVKNYTKQLLAAMPRLVVNKPVPQSTAPVLLDVKNITKTFPVPTKGWWGSTKPFAALKNVSLQVRAGEIFGIVGESGSGKSTLARCLVKLLPADGGEVLFQNTNVLTQKGEALRQLRKNMQMVFQDPYSSLNPRMKIGDSVGEGLLAHNVMPAREREEYIKYLLNECGLPLDSYGRYPHQFSGGQRQRICIARALALKPKLVIADEPVSALDVSVQKQILELMQNMREKFGVSYIFISHDLRIVSQIADKVAVMRHGEIIEQGAVADVFGRPKSAYTRSLLRALPGEEIAA